MTDCKRKDHFASSRSQFDRVVLHLIKSLITKCKIVFRLFLIRFPCNNIYNRNTRCWKLKDSLCMVWENCLLQIKVVLLTGMNSLWHIGYVYFCGIPVKYVTTYCDAFVRKFHSKLKAYGISWDIAHFIFWNMILLL